MPRPFQILDSVETHEGLLELRRRGDSDFMILVGGRVLMTSKLSTSETTLANKGCSRLPGTHRPRILIGGLGLGLTLRATLDALPKDAQVVVAELNQKVVDWCRGLAAAASDSAALDRRVRFVVGDVNDVIRRTAADPSAQPFDAILWDLYLGPPLRGGSEDPLYGDASLSRANLALREGGVFAVWGEKPSTVFEERLRRLGFATEIVRTGGAGLRHTIYVALKNLQS